MTIAPNIYQKDYRLTAAGCNAQSELPLSVLISNVIETATAHANLLGIGFAKLIESRASWVLSRLTVEVSRYPKMHEDYSLVTWIESFNRHFSGRNFELKSGEGEILGYIRTIWVAIDVDTRRPADISSLANPDMVINQKICPIPSQGRIAIHDKGTIMKDYVFETTDIDFNRHVTTTRYVELHENQLPLATYDTNLIHRFEIAFHHEAVWGETARIVTSETGNDEFVTTIYKDKETAVCSSRIILKRRM